MKTRVLLVSLGTALAAVVANAQPSSSTASPDSSPASADSGSDTDLQQVVVTARRRQERQQDVPLAVTALSADFLRENAIVGVHDLNGKVPALNVENFNSPAYTNIGIRGQRADNIAPGQDPAVGYYFGEVSYSYPVGINEQLFDLQSLEVVKGPQGTLFGRNTTGGAVLISPAMPDTRFGGSVLAGMTAFDHGLGYYTTGILNLPVTDTFQLRAAVNVIDHDGYVKNLITPQELATFEQVPFTGSSGANPDDENSKAWRISALWHPIDTLQSWFLYQGSHYRDDGMAYSLTAVDPNGLMNLALGGQATSVFQQRQAQQANDFWTTQSGLNAYNRSDNHAGSNITTWTPTGSLTVKNIIGYRHFSLSQAVPLDGVPFQILDSTIGDDGHELSEELQVQGHTIADLLDWVVGYYYANQHIDHPRSTNTLPQLGVPISHAFEVSDNGTHAEYAQGTLKIPPVRGLSLTAGIRNTRDGRRMTSTSWNAPGQTSCAITGVVGCQLGGDVAYNVVTYNVGLEYKLDPDTLIYATRRKGYRAGGWNYVGSDPVSFGPFKPEYVNDWEAGLKRDWSLGETKLRTNLAVYRSRLSDAQKLLSPVSNPNEFEVINAADATIKGGELEVTFIPVKALQLSGYLSIIDARFNSFVFGGNDFTNNTFGQTPKTQYTLRGSYDLPLPGTIGTVSVEADYFHQSHIFYTDTAEGPTQGPLSSQGQGPYGIVNTRLDWRSIWQSHFDVAFYVKNAGATRYNTFGVMLYPSLGYNIATLGEPRVFGFETTYHF
ncbi:MAG: TonB-dependent receptor [Sinobacteraceae bacterium]|nr:TonB-dependent receptor [Nevskiaceae bacterium]